LAMAQARHASGRDLLRSIVAGFEVMHRVGTATLHSPEKRGFHAPGIVGPFGAAIASGVLMGLDSDRLTQAMGIAGSLGAGLLAFSKAGSGGMVKRLHMGRAAESGILAAQLAAGGYEGPDTVLDGTFGVLEAYCNDHDATLLTAGLGSTWQTSSLAIKSFACHITAHIPVHMLRSLMAQYGFAGNDIAALRLHVSDKVLSHHTSRQPGDIMQVQYSVPYVVAVAAYRDPADPASFRADAISDADIKRLAELIVLEPQRDIGGKRGPTELKITLRDGRQLEDAATSFLGCPDQPLNTDQLRAKFLVLTKDRIADPERLFDSLMSIGNNADVSSLWKTGAR
ncbi:MAG: MmgE/PrpD family protein, partial [Rhodospirillaceae bacterium]|nr:MmgE/PrpD family protein [Rhodospirillaceae bacterium]